MTTFTAQSREPAVAVLPGSKTPESDDGALRELGATEFYPRKFEYLHKQHTMRDMIRPGYFNGEARARLCLGDEIHYTACGGQKSPCDWERGILVVEEKPNIKEKPLIVGIVLRYRKATPVRHDGQAVEE